MGWKFDLFIVGFNVTVAVIRQLIKTVHQEIKSCKVIVVSYGILICIQTSITGTKFVLHIH